MQFTGITRAEVESTVRKVSEDKYDGNISFSHTSDQSPTRFRGRIVAVSSFGKGTRSSWSGRRGPWACWHATRDVLTALFDAHPEVKVRSSVGRDTVAYLGRDSFLREFPDTAYAEIGSMMSPMSLVEACNGDC